MTLILVSVASADEAEIAIAGGADIVDLCGSGLGVGGVATIGRTDRKPRRTGRGDVGRTLCWVAG